MVFTAQSVRCSVSEIRGNSGLCQELRTLRVVNGTGDHNDLIGPVAERMNVSRGI